jgi:hypothetical protein
VFRHNAKRFIADKSTEKVRMVRIDFKIVLQCEKKYVLNPNIGPDDGWSSKRL